jgi:hypothetical protein
MIDFLVTIAFIERELIKFEVRELEGREKAAIKDSIIM